MRINDVRNEAPLVLCITNDVVKNFTANGLLALGASPIMAADPQELDELIQHCGAVLINIGTLSAAVIPSIETAIQSANRHAVPVVLDPVACGATAFRKNFCLKLLHHYDISVIRGNASELQSLLSAAEMKGTDSDTTLNTSAIARAAGLHFSTAVVVTGQEDAVCVDGQVMKLTNGTPMLTKVTGGGCLLGAIVSAFIYNEVKPTLSMLTEAISWYNIAAERAEQLDNGTLPGHFQMNLLDMLQDTGENDIVENMRAEEVK